MREPGGAGTGVVRPGLLPALRGVAVLFAALVLTQAMLAGRGWFVDYDLIEVHGWVGNAVFLVAVAQAVLAFAVFGPGALRQPLPLAAALLVLLTVAQIGLGYAGRESGEAASWHVPNGVLIFGLSVLTVSLAFRPEG